MIAYMLRTGDNQRNGLCPKQHETERDINSTAPSIADKFYEIVTQALDAVARLFSCFNPQITKDDIANYTNCSVEYNTNYSKISDQQPDYDEESEWVEVFTEI